RKRIVGSRPAQHHDESDQSWLDLGQIATVEVTSEDPGFPIESAFDLKSGPGWRASQTGWRASQKGEQQIRIIFDEPIALHRIQIRFHETESARTQEFVVRCSFAEGRPAEEIVRQQWNFDPGGSTTEAEDYAVNLDAVSGLELVIQPDLGGNKAIATLAAWRLR
ncbi:MAG: carbohydrate-binding protein, partial [Bryobacteraceae bacterium]